MTGRFLTQEYEREMAEIIARLRDETHLSLISDGWASVNKEKVIDYVVAPFMRPLLWCITTVGGN